MNTGRLRSRLTYCSAAFCLLLGPSVAAEVGVYQTRSEFLLDALGNAQPDSAVVWIDESVRKRAAEAVGHPPETLRVRYWFAGSKKAWIIDEVGKDKPITFGIVIQDGAIQDLRVLQFRESRGWEVRYPFFTKQFGRVTLNSKDALSRDIDSITGATLSVEASTRAARLALILDEYTQDT